VRVYPVYHERFLFGVSVYDISGSQSEPMWRLTLYFWRWELRF